MSTYSVTQQPDLIAPAYNDLIFVVTSSNNGQTNFNYIATIYIGSDIITLKAPANPTYGSGVFNFGRIVEAYVNSDINRTGFGFQRNSNSYKSYYIKFGEEYGSTITQYLNITTTAVKYAYNGIFDFNTFYAYAMASYSLDGSGGILNNQSPSITRKFYDADYGWFYWFSNDTTTLSHIAIRGYNSAGALVSSAGVTNPYKSSGTIDNHFLRVGIGKPQLNGLSAGDLKYGSLPILPATAASYQIEFQDASSGSITNTFTVTINDADCRYTNYRLHFLNEAGGFESFNFNKLSNRSVTNNKSQYKAPVGALTSASAFGYTRKDRGDRQYFISSKETVTLRTDWLNDAEIAWLKELIESPEIYLDDPTYGLVSVTCIDTKFDYKTSLNDKLFNLEIQIKYSYDKYRQRY